MNTLRISFFATVMTAVIGMSGCGGTQTAEGGVGGTGISNGSITRFGSVVVNGVVFNTDNAEFTKDGAAAVQNDLSEGMVVTIQGTINADGVSGTAETVTYLKTLQGQVDSIGSSSFVVLGQTIVVDGETRGAGGALFSVADIAEGDFVEVSGFFTATDNVIHATYVEIDDSQEYEIKGVIDSVDASNNEFTIGQLIVATSEADMYSVGDFVEVEGDLDSMGRLVATSIEQLNKGLELEDADEAELEGLVTSDCQVTQTSICRFNIGFIAVEVRDTTEFEGGGLLANVQSGVRLEVEGTLVGGVIIAEEIEFEDTIELESDVVALSSNALILDFEEGTVPVLFDESTELDGFDAFNEINIGAHIRVRARDTGNGIKAARIEDKEDEPDVELQAPVQSKTEEGITLLGIYFDLTSIPVGEYEFGNLSAFLDAISAGDVVSLTGEFDLNGGIQWEQIELED